jgi:hypothetical protein
MHYRLKKALAFVFPVAILTFFLKAFFYPVPAYAEGLITNRTGTIRITHPDGVVSVVAKDKPLGPIPSGSTVEVLSGSIDVAPTEGFIQIVVGDSVAMIDAGERITASVDPKTKLANFSIVVGEVSIITGNTTTTMRTGQEVVIGLDKFTGTVKVRSISGNINTVTAGVRTLILQGGLVQIRVDSQTRQVHIVSTAGTVEVTSPEGARTILARGESRDIQGSLVGEVLTFPGEVIEITALPTEEPAEPEWPEASPHRP